MRSTAARLAVSGLRRCRFFFFSSRRRHTRCSRDWSSDVCSSDLVLQALLGIMPTQQRLDALDVPRRDVDLRLIVQQELLLIERRPQLVLETDRKSVV